ncbi:MarR family transcriptional regulator [Paenibacillus sp. TRM 82003]|uniref:MarR family winged helix-turn-helix transcriptional regulator n=1 Tax=Kineococcus sp. TRM81007 TaxID=2925831 RepID=UPI001F59179C|nr:MarR family transcriptional regulator [Kineococcus sp. TRM81007]MCI2239101.1 MarR family transcriptional regulator [Kineococcus sp. TRM81007]MCI3924520.1 MarR family transcriptional regulator [Paenibacillus sp. TRM 82003]
MATGEALPQTPSSTAERTGSTRWLDPEEQRTWRSFLATVQLLMDRVDRQLQQESGVVHTYYEMLVRLSEAPGRSLRMSELAESSLSSRSRVSHAVARMEERGWIRREPCATDGRGFNAVLTDEGLRALEAAAPAHVETVRSLLFDRLDAEEQLQLRRTCEVLLQHLTDTGSVSPVPLVAPLGDG